MKKLWKREFDYADWLDAVERKPTQVGSSRMVGNKLWNGTDTYEQAMVLARKGWPEGLRRIDKISKEIWSVVGQEIQTVEPVYDVCGAFADVDRYLTGEPENMVQFVEEQEAGRGKVVKLFVNTACSGGVETDTIFNRGAAVVALVDALEKLGFSCEVMIVDSTAGGWHGDQEVLQYEVMVRRAGEPLDLDRLAFCMANPAFARRLVFSAMEHETDPHVRQLFGIGHSYGNPTETRGHTDEVHGIDVPSLRLGAHSWRTQAEAIKWVLACAAKIIGRPVEKID